MVIIGLIILVALFLMIFIYVRNLLKAKLLEDNQKGEAAEMNQDLERYNELDRIVNQIMLAE